MRESVFILSCIKYCSYMKLMSFCCLINIYWSNSKMTSKTKWKHSLAWYFTFQTCIPCDKTFNIIPLFFYLMTLTLNFESHTLNIATCILIWLPFYEPRYLLTALVRSLIQIKIACSLNYTQKFVLHTLLGEPFQRYATILWKQAHPIQTISFFILNHRPVYMTEITLNANTFLRKITCWCVTE